MNKNRVIYSLLVVIGLLALGILALRNEPKRREPVDRHPERLVITRHARCRMDCRRIDEGEIREILEKGAINFSKSDAGDRPCPSYALQGTTASGERIRIIVGQCRNETRIITCYNLDVEYPCHCPGDEKKN